MQAAAFKVHFARPGMAQRTAVAQPRRAVLVRGAPEKSAIDSAVKEAQEACAGGDSGEW